jgi:hypothetical protein
MNKIMAAVAAVAVILLLGGIARAILVKVQPPSSSAIAQADAAASRPAISPFEIMSQKGNGLPVEDWGNAF